MIRPLFYLVACLLLLSPVLAQSEIAMPETIADYDSPPDAILEALVTEGVVPLGATPVLTQADLTYSGDNPRFSTFTTETPIADFVMGATIDFSPQQQASGALEYCGLAARAQQSETSTLEDTGNVTTLRLSAYLAVGVDNEGSIFAFETDDDPDTDATPLEVVEADVALDTPLYLLAISIEDALTVYANGDLLISDYPLTGEAGAFSFLYVGSDPESACRAQTLFVYAMPEIAEGECLVGSDSVINRRAGPGTQFAVLDQFTGDETLAAAGQAQGTDGFIWWQLDDETWVREDVATAIGYCLSLPVVDNDDG